MAQLTMHEAYASATARHVSPEGCQLVIDNDSVARGQRFSLEVGGKDTVSGAVRWVVGDRVGFAFDSPIGTDEIRALQRGSARASALELYLLNVGQNSPDRP